MEIGEQKLTNKTVETMGVKKKQNREIYITNFLQNA